MGMYKYINFIVHVVGLSIIKKTRLIYYDRYLFIYYECIGIYLFYDEIIAIIFIAIQICFITHGCQPISLLQVRRVTRESDNYCCLVNPGYFTVSCLQCFRI